MPGREHRQRTEQADPRPWRAWLAGAPVQPGQLVGAVDGGEHVPPLADELGDHRVVEPERGDQPGVVAGQGDGILAGDHHGRARRSRSCWASSTMASAGRRWDGVVALR